MKISVIVPVRNEERSIVALLDGLLAQTRLPDEIVVSDNGSSDRSAEIIEGFVQRGEPVRLVRERPGFPGRGRNVAAAQASHEWLAFIDAGIRPKHDWLEKLAARADDSGADVVYGNWEPVTDTFFKECAAIAYVPPPAAVAEGWIRPRFIASSIFRHEAWQKAGGFPEHLRSAEDLLFMTEVERMGFKAVSEPQAVVIWDVQPNLWRTFQRFVSYSRNNIRAGLWRQWQAAIFLRYALILGWAIPTFLLGWWWLLGSVGLWLGMMVARAAISIQRNRMTYPAGLTRNIKRVFLLVPIFAAVDLSALFGAIDWLVRDKFGPGKTNQ